MHNSICTGSDPVAGTLRRGKEGGSEGQGGADWAGQGVFAPCLWCRDWGCPGKSRLEQEKVGFQGTDIYTAETP